MDPPNRRLSPGERPTSDPRPHCGNNLEVQVSMNLKPTGLVLTIFIPESTANEQISSLPCLRPGNASQNARTRASARVRASRITIESPEVYI